MPTTQVRAGLIRMCGVVHTSIKVFADKFYEELVRRVYTTPKSYLDLINSFTAKLGVLQGTVETKAQQMEVCMYVWKARAAFEKCMVYFWLALYSVLFSYVGNGGSMLHSMSQTRGA